MGKYKTLAKNTGFVFIGTIGSKVINFIMLPIYTHWLTPSEFGAVDTMDTYAAFIMGFVCLCLPDAIFIFPRKVNEEKRAEYFSSGLCFSIITIGISACFFWAVSELMLSYNMVNVFSKYVWMIYAIMVATYMQSYLQSFARSLDKMLCYSITGIVLTFSIAAYSIILIPLYGLHGYVYALVLAHTTAALYTFFGIKAYRYLTLKNSTTNSVKEMLTYSAPLLPNSIMWWLVDGINRPVMERFLGLSAIGLYAVARKFSNLLWSFLTILGLAWNNSVLDEYGSKEFEKFYNNYLKMLTVSLCIVGLLISAFSRSLVQLLTTPEYYEAYKYAPVLVLGIIFSGLSSTVGSVFSAIKKSKYFFYSSIYGGIASVVSLFLLTPLFGLMGTAISVTISFFCILVARLIYSWHYAKIENLWLYFTILGVFIISIIIEVNVDSITLRMLTYIISVVYIFYMCKKEFVQLLMMLKQKIIRQ